MLRSYFKTAFRNIQRNKTISAINIFSLSIGLACAILIGILVNYELSFDKFHNDLDNIYRVYTKADRPEGIAFMAPVQFPLAEAAREDIPELKNSIVITQFTSLVSKDDSKFYEELYFTTEDFFDVFNFPMKSGDPAKALSEPTSIVISERAAEKYFGNDDPIGKTLTVRINDLFVVTGVFYNFPKNSSLETDFIASNKSLTAETFNRFGNWTSFGNDYMFVKIYPGSDVSSIEEKLLAVLRKNHESEELNKFSYHLLPFSDVHLPDIDFMYDPLKTTPPVFLIVFSIIAFFFLLVACVNFINLTTARAARRGKEVGIRKVSGASKPQLVFQFLSETIILTLVSFGISILILQLLIPQVNAMINVELSLLQLVSPANLLFASVVIIFTAVISGVYPAFVLSGFKPSAVFKSSGIKTKGRYSLRAVLVVFQFAVSGFLIIGTFVIYNQIDYLLTKDLGFAKDRIFVVSLDDVNLRSGVEPFKQSVLGIPGVSTASFSSGTPGSGYSQSTPAKAFNNGREVELQTFFIDADYDFIKTYSLEITSGRMFMPEFTSDSINSIVINETAVKKFGLTDPIGTRMDFSGERYYVKGVVEDFHYFSLRSAIPPMAIFLNNERGRFLSVQLSADDVVGTVEKIKEKHLQFTGYPFNAFFVNESFEQYYNIEKTLGKFLTALSFLAVFIGCIGILGLVAYTTEQKSKEIGIRKVLGASVASIVMMLGKEFLKWVLIANVLMFPPAYILFEEWLSTFAYRTELNFIIFASALFISLMITSITVGYHAIKAATANPVKSLKYE